VQQPSERNLRPMTGILGLVNGNAAASAAVSMTRPPPIRSIPTGSPLTQLCQARHVVGRVAISSEAVRARSAASAASSCSRVGACTVKVMVTVNSRPSPRATRSASS
jgi:hypothetical protein